MHQYYDRRESICDSNDNSAALQCQSARINVILITVTTLQSAQRQLIYMHTLINALRYKLSSK